MVSYRIRIAKDKAELLRELVEGKATTGAFQTYADALVFAASLGAKYQKRISIEEVSKNEPGPISLEVFISRGYDWAIKLLAIAATNDTRILSYFDHRAEEQRILIFEEYANGGLEKLSEEMRGAVDATERLFLIISKERFSENNLTEEFDLSKFL